MRSVRAMCVFTVVSVVVGLLWGGYAFLRSESAIQEAASLVLVCAFAIVPYVLTRVVQIGSAASTGEK